MPPWKQLPNYIEAFGVATGVGLFSAIHLKQRAFGSLFTIRRGRRKIWLRNTPSDTSIFFQIMVKREYDTRCWPVLHERLANEYARLVEKKCKPIIIDAGANIGLASLWFAELFPESTIYAIEPDEGNLSVLRRNVCGVSNIIPVAGAVWDRPSRLRITNPTAGAGAFRVEEGVGDIRSYTISELANEYRELFIVKIDIEGGEAGLFRSNFQWLEAVHLSILELHDWLYPGQGTSHNFLRAISEREVDFVFNGENVFCFRSD